VNVSSRTAPPPRTTACLAHFHVAFLILSLAICAVAATGAAHAQNQETQWTQPTQEELSMTSQPQVPGAAAVYLNWDEQTDDHLHMRSVYARVKVLTEAGKDRANVSLAYASYFSNDYPGMQDFSQTVTDVAGRTIHSDGTVIPFTGKPYERVLEKKKGETASETVFTLPDVEVGSILEYRFKYRIPDNWYQPPRWFVQKDMFVRKGHFFWKASDIFLDYGGAETLAYSAVLPKGTEVKMSSAPGTDTAHGYHRFELETHDIPPLEEEAFMPPMQSLTYRVSFYEAAYATQDQFWKERGNAWAKEVEHFIGSRDSLSGQLQTLVAIGDPDTVKLQTIYTAVMAMDNTNYSRRHSESENKAHGLGKIKTASDITERKVGSGDELTALFVALARAAGMKAYIMAVTNRDNDLFSPAWPTLSQLNDLVAIVVLDGKEQFFDPGQRYCPFGQMAWKHTGVGGLRELDNGAAALAVTSQPPYTQSETRRTGEITMNADGSARGTLQITWTGAPALDWRQVALRKDEAAVKDQMKDWAAERIPAGMQLNVETIDNLTDYEHPLVVTMSVHGQFATVSAKRLIVPSQFYESNSKPLFPQPERDIPIYFEHGGRVLDGVLVKFPADLKVESVPKENQFMLQKLASYHSIPSVQASAVLMRRQYDLGTAFFSPKDYGDVREFYNKMAVNDQQAIVLLRPDASGSQSNVEPKAQR
jgi:hypothetical protein